MADPVSGKTAECWVISEGHAGMENQARGLAERIGLPFRMLRVRPRPPWTWLPPGLWPAPLRALGPDSDRPEPPWPRLVVSCGRRAVPFALLARQSAGGRAFAVHIQDPKTRLDRFDLVVAPAHDRLAGSNVIETVGSLPHITPGRLAEAAAGFEESVAHLPRPLVAVLVGGTSTTYRLEAAEARELAEQLSRLAGSEGIGLAVTPSRRTGAANIRILREGLRDAPAVVWDLAGANPYLGWLGLADAVLVTCDSVNMVTEACVTGRPVQILDLPGGNARFARFHATMRERGYTRPFRGRLEHWTYDPPDDTGRVAMAVRKALGLAA